MSNVSLCSICGEPMPVGEEMFKFHGYSGPCPKPPKIQRAEASEARATALEEEVKRLRRFAQEIADLFKPKHQAALDAWKDAGTAAFDDPVWMEAAEYKPLSEKAKEALVASPLSCALVEREKQGTREGE